MLLITKISKFLNDVDFPIMKDEIIASAIDMDTEDDVVSELVDLPYDLYNSKDEILIVLSKRGVK